MDLSNELSFFYITDLPMLFEQYYLLLKVFCSTTALFKFIWRKKTQGCLYGKRKLGVYVWQNAVRSEVKRYCRKIVKISADFDALKWFKIHYHNIIFNLENITFVAYLRNITMKSKYKIIKNVTYSFC